MNTWIINLKKIKLELDAQDIERVISRRTYASKLMRGSGLPSDKRTQVLFHAGGVYDPEKLSAVLRLSHTTIYKIMMNAKVKLIHSSSELRRHIRQLRNVIGLRTIKIKMKMAKPTKMKTTVMQMSW